MESSWTKDWIRCLVLIVQFSRSVVSDSLRPRGLQHARHVSPSLTPRAYSDSCASSRWGHPAVPSSVVPVSSCPRSLPAPCVLCLVAQTCLTLVTPVDPPGSSVHGILQARILEWVAISFSGDLPDPGIEPRSSALQADSLLTEISGSFPMSQFFTSGGQSIGASASVLPMNIQDWFPLRLTGWLSLQSKGLSRVFSNTTVQKHQFLSSWLSL